MLTKGEFESRYNREIMLIKIGEGVSFDSALDNLWFEYNRLKGDEEKFKELLKEWELD